MAEYKNYERAKNLKKKNIIICWDAPEHEEELMKKCQVIEEARVGHEIRLNDMMRTLAMKRVREIVLSHDLKERQKDKNYGDNQLKFTKAVLQSFEEVQD